MKILSYTSQVKKILNKNKDISKIHKKETKLHFSKINLCPFEVHIITPNLDILEKSEFSSVDPETIIKLHQAWQGYLKGYIPNTISFENAYNSILHYGEQCSSKAVFFGNFIRRYKMDPNRNTFFLLFNDKNIHDLLIFYLMRLCNIWQVSIDKIPLHASGIVIDNSLYLFSGPSQVGKSTIAKLLSKLGGEILDEDQVMIRKTDTGYTADAWGYSLNTQDKDIRGVFKLVQSDHNELIEIPKTSMAHFVCEQSFEITGGFLPDDLNKNLFLNICQFVRDVPHYELHFQKNPVFWTLIKNKLNV